MKVMESAKQGLEYKLIDSLDEVRLFEYYLKNTDHFKLWEPKRAANFSDKSYWHARFKHQLDVQSEGRAAYFIAVNRQNVIAHCNLSQINYGVFRACYMGYGVDQSFEGQSVVRGLCEFVINEAFSKLNLHRIMAAYMPYNNRSGRLLKRLGFEREGFAKHYLKINGHWEDHVLMALVNHSAV